MKPNRTISLSIVLTFCLLLSANPAHAITKYYSLTGNVFVPAGNDPFYEYSKGPVNLSLLYRGVATYWYAPVNIPQGARIRLSPASLGISVCGNCNSCYAEIYLIKSLTPIGLDNFEELISVTSINTNTDCRIQFDSDIPQGPTHTVDNENEAYCIKVVLYNTDVATTNINLHKVLLKYEVNAALIND